MPIRLNKTTTLALADDVLRARFSALASSADVASLLEVTHQRLVWHLWRRPADSRYAKFQIKKRRGGVRQITAPLGGLGILQGKLAQVLRAVYVPGDSAHGFIRSRSIVTNAAPHVGRRYVLNVDIEDFFPSIHFGRVRGLLMAWPYERNEEVATTLAQLCFAGEKGLPQGAPTSPTIANMICAAMDARLARLVQVHTCTYTRYSDDLTISTTKKRFPRELATRVGDVVELGHDMADVLSRNGFTANLAKLRLQTRFDRQEVTGLVTNERLNVRRKLVRQIRAMLHAWRVFGYEAAEREFRERWDSKHRAQASAPPQFFEVVRGKLSFLAMVRGREDRMYTELVHRARRLDDRFNGVVTREDAVLVVNRDEDAFIEDGIESQGTGFVLAGVGFVTAGHVVCAPNGTVLSGMKAVRAHGLSEAANVRVFLPEYGLDFAVCQIPFKNVPALQLGDAATVRRGDTVTILGFPHWSDGHTVTETQARVVGRTRRHNADRIDLDSPMHRGNSGGPVLDRNGKVIGVAVTGSNDGEFPNSAIPISLIRERAHQLGIDLEAESAYLGPTGSTGSPG